MTTLDAQVRALATGTGQLFSAVNSAVDAVRQKADGEPALRNQAIAPVSDLANYARAQISAPRWAVLSDSDKQALEPGDSVVGPDKVKYELLQGGDGEVNPTGGGAGWFAIASQAATFSEALNRVNHPSVDLTTAKHGASAKGGAKYYTTGVVSIGSASTGNELSFYDAGGVQWSLADDANVNPYMLGAIDTNVLNVDNSFAIHKMRYSTNYNLDLIDEVFKVSTVTIGCKSVINGSVCQLPGATGSCVILIGNVELLDAVKFTGNQSSAVAAEDLGVGVLYNRAGRVVFKRCVMSGFARNSINRGEVELEQCEFSDMPLHGGTSGETTYALSITGLCTRFKATGTRIIGPETSSINNPGGIIQTHADAQARMCDVSFYDTYSIRIGQGAHGNYVGTIDVYKNARTVVINGVDAADPTYSVVKVGGGETIRVKGIKIDGVNFEDIAGTTAPLVTVGYTATHGIVVPKTIDVEMVTIAGEVSPANKASAIQINIIGSAELTEYIKIAGFSCVAGLAHGLDVDCDGTASGMLKRLHFERFSIKKTKAMGGRILRTNKLRIVMEEFELHGQIYGLQMGTTTSDGTLIATNMEMSTQSGVLLFTDGYKVVQITDAVMDSPGAVQVSPRNADRVEITRMACSPNVFFNPAGSANRLLKGNTGGTTWADIDTANPPPTRKDCSGSEAGTGAFYTALGDAATVSLGTTVTAFNFIAPSGEVLPSEMNYKLTAMTDSTTAWVRV